MSASNSSNALAMQALGESKGTRLAAQIFLIAAGVCIIAISSKFKIPLWPNPTPVTLQTLAIFTISAAYGGRLAIATLLGYLAVGALGAPVFTGTPEQGIGVGYMIGATGGYIIGFLIMAAITGWAADRGWSRNPFKLGGAMLVGEVVMLTLGALWMGYLYGADKIVAWGIGPFIVTDLIKLAIAACVVPAVWQIFARKV